jgi:hypothetical protein
METKLIYLVNQQKLVSQIDEVGSELGEPDCKLVSPFVLKEDGSLEQFLMGATRDTTFMMSSDKILTLAEPTPTLLEKYQDLTKE